MERARPGAQHGRDSTGRIPRIVSHKTRKIRTSREFWPTLHRNPRSERSPLPSFSTSSPDTGSTPSPETQHSGSVTGESSQLANSHIPPAWRPLMGKRVIRFFSERRSSGLLALQVRSTRLVTTLRRTRAVAGDKAFTDCREVRPFMALARNTSGVGACPPM